LIFDVFVEEYTERFPLEDFLLSLVLIFCVNELHHVHNMLVGDRVWAIKSIIHVAAPLAS